MLGGRLASPWEQPGPGGCGVCRATPKPLDPELQPVLEGTRRDWGLNRAPLKPAAPSLWSQGEQAPEPADHRPLTRTEPASCTSLCAGRPPLWLPRC